MMASPRLLNGFRAKKSRESMAKKAVSLAGSSEKTSMNCERAIQVRQRALESLRLYLFDRKKQLGILGCSRRIASEQSRAHGCSRSELNCSFWTEKEQRRTHREPFRSVRVHLEFISSSDEFRKSNQRPGKNNERPGKSNERPEKSNERPEKSGWGFRTSLFGFSIAREDLQRAADDSELLFFDSSRAADDPSSSAGDGCPTVEKACLAAKSTSQPGRREERTAGTRGPPGEKSPMIGSFPWRPRRPGGDPLRFQRPVNAYARSTRATRSSYA